MTATDHFAITGFIVLCALIAIGVHICNLAVKDMGLSRDLRKITFLYPSRIREGQGPESGMLLQDISNITGRCLSKYKQLLPRVEQCRLKNLERPIHPNRVRIDGICTDLLDRKKWIAILQCYQITAENIALLRIRDRVDTLGDKDIAALAYNLAAVDELIVGQLSSVTKLLERQVELDPDEALEKGIASHLEKIHLLRETPLAKDRPMDEVELSSETNIFRESPPRFTRHLRECQRLPLECERLAIALDVIYREVN